MSKVVAATLTPAGETVAEKPMFRSAFKCARCIIPASGYYEWRTVNGAKQPYYFSASDAGVLSIAGLWDESKDISTSGLLRSCTMIVTEANKFAGRVHGRMPVFLASDSFEAWLDGSARVELLRPAPENLACLACIEARQPIRHRRRRSHPYRSHRQLILAETFGLASGIVDQVKNHIRRFE